MPGPRGFSMMNAELAGEFWLDLASSLFGVLLSVSAVLACIAFGWILIWKLFLSRFEFIREIVNSGAEEKNKRRRQSISPELKDPNRKAKGQRRIRKDE